ncbi:MAG: Lrp/AsnC family transcriptional regulator [Gammaproteobacteria bacterium]|nr:Lrp/AsnC family transcriptional regulator [Gammaproteobacteria bacterium]TVQ49186.1 MAG: Lrp/AsnC family transcriptional regulator [Gammaproteobacteria bacterium]
MSTVPDATDRQILRELQRDGRISVAELAERVHLSATPCLRRLRKLERAGLIQGYTALVDEGALGFPVSAFAFVKLERTTQDNARLFESALQHFPEVIECNSVAGAHDYVLRIVAQDLAAYEAFVKNRLATVEPVAQIETMIVLNRPLVRHELPS